MVTAHSLRKTFTYRHEKLMVEQRPEVYWEDSMLVYQGLESSREPRLASLAPLFSASPRGQHWMLWWSLCHSDCSWRPSQGFRGIRCFPSLPFLEQMTWTLSAWNSCVPMPWSSLTPWRIYLAPGPAVVVTARSSMKALMDGCLIPDLVSGPLHSVSALLACMFIASKKRTSNYAHF